MSRPKVYRYLRQLDSRFLAFSPHSRFGAIYFRHLRWL